MNRDEFLVCREYASMDLAFSLYNLHEMIFDVPAEDSAEETDRRSLYGLPVS